MPSSPSLVELSLAAFVERVAGARPASAGGRVAALQGALGAALTSMAFRHAAGEGGSAFPAYMEGRADELRELSRHLLALVDRDAACEAPASASDGGREQAARSALEAPLQVAETALAGLRLAAVGAPAVAAPLASECAAGADALAAAVRGGLGLVHANAAFVGEGDWVEDRLAVLPVLESEASRLLAEIHGVLEEKE